MSFETKDLKRHNIYLTKENNIKFEILKVLFKLQHPEKKPSVTQLINEIIEFYYENNKPNEAVEELIKQKM